MIYKIISLLLLVSLLVSLFFGNSARKERDLYKTKVQNDFTTKYLILERRLQASESARGVLNSTIDSLNIRIKSLSESNLTLDRELSKVKGKYANKQPSELEKLMIDK